MVEIGSSLGKCTEILVSRRGQLLAKHPVDVVGDIDMKTEMETGLFFFPLLVVGAVRGGCLWICLA